MVLGCFMCREPLLGVKTNRTLISPKHGKYGLTGAESRISPINPQNRDSSYSLRSKYSFSLDSGAGRAQPMATRCGHVFHKGCIKDYLEQAPKVGLKKECPICLKGISYPHCFPVYFDAVKGKDGRGRMTDFLQEQLKQVEAENAKLMQSIAEAPSLIEKGLDELTGIRRKTEQIADDLTKEEDETERLLEYIKSVGGFRNVKSKYGAVVHRFQALGMQNTQLGALIEEQAKALTAAKQAQVEGPLNEHKPQISDNESASGANSKAVRLSLETDKCKSNVDRDDGGINEQEDSAKDNDDKLPTEKKANLRNNLDPKYEDDYSCYTGLETDDDVTYNNYCTSTTETSDKDD